MTFAILRKFEQNLIGSNVHLAKPLNINSNLLTTIVSYHQKVVLPDALLHQDLHLLLHLPQLLLKLEQLSLPLVLRIVILTVSRTGVVFHETS